MVRRKRFVFCVCILPVTLCCAYLLCVFSVYRRRSLQEVQLPQDSHQVNDLHIQRNGHPHWANVIAEKFVQLSLFHSLQTKAENGSNCLEASKTVPTLKAFQPHNAAADTYLGGSHTDVDRTELRKKKKRIEKLRKGLANRCRKHEQSACQELELLRNKNSLNRTRWIRDGNLTTILILGNGSYEQPLWNSFADKGFTIVGNKEALIQRLPQVLIIGAKKAGTRALLEFLRLHPSVTAAGSELHFFDTYFYRGLSWYRSELPPSLEGQLTIEKTPAYFVDRDVPKRVKESLPTVKLLLVVRDPVVRAISDFAQSLSKHEKRRAFKDLVLKNTSSGLVNVAWGPVRGGLYARHFQRWKKYFPMTSIHVISGENLVTDPAGEMATVQDFLGVERVINDKHFYFNVTKGFPCLMKREKNGRPHCLGYSKGRAHPVVDEETLQILRDFYRPFNAKFYKLVGRNFGWP